MNYTSEYDSTELMFAVELFETGVKTMNYAELIKVGIENRQLSLSQVCLKLAKRDVWLDRAALSKLRNGKLPPAKDEVNQALAEVIGIDPTSLRLAAAREVIGDELFELIRSAG